MVYCSSTVTTIIDMNQNQDGAFSISHIHLGCMDKTQMTKTQINVLITYINTHVHNIVVHVRKLINLLELT